AMVARNNGHFDEARAILKELMKVPAGPDSTWRPIAQRTLAELTFPSSFFLPLAEALAGQNNLADAVLMVDNGIMAFPKDSFPREYHAPLAERALLRLNLARNKVPGNLADDLVKESKADTAEALEGGETVEGPYVQGRIAKEQGDLAKAEAGYRAALKAYEQALGDGSDKARAAFFHDHPVSDLGGSRYRLALAKVLLAEAEAAQRKPAPMEKKPEGSKQGRQE